ncbi:MAG: glycosyltransferase [Erysipelotrichaceae bacterium]|nr:glycosyltransferase [Erysipelotrichaceae bacterium]
MNKTAVLIPCYNEEMTIEKVVSDFRRELPEANIYVYDNNSTDDSVKLAAKAGAIVRQEPLQGKGNAVRSMFRDIEADIYLMVDGDDTYPAEEAQKLINLIKDGADMAVGDRLSSTYFSENRRPFHGFGNLLVRFLIKLKYKAEVSDIMSGYRAFSREFVKQIDVKSPGFEVETEMTIFALKNKKSIRCVPVQYRDRPEGSYSKLSTFSDGLKVLMTILKS